ncbi:MAG: GspH/FimT family pseudopilin [Gammaproteobacteria bacterium]|nr:GspH/FimT family pseudopilin [Gammaproteobacteria bacterium]
MARKNRVKLSVLAIVVCGLGILSLAGTGVASLLETRTAGVALEDLTNDIYFARRTAADTKTPVTVCQSEDASSCANNGHWESGWLLFEDYDRDSVRDPHEKILRSQGPVSGRATIRAKEGAASRVFSSIAFTRFGLPKHISGMSLNGTLRICNAEASTTKVGLKVTSVGSTYTTKNTQYECV